MRRQIIIAVALALSALSALAQADLQIASMFGGKYANDPGVTEINLSGDQRFLKSKHLNCFMTFKGDAKTYAPKIQPMVLADGSHATGRNVRYKDGMLQYAYFVLKPKIVDGKTLNRYIYYIYNHKSDPATVMLIYFDGPISRRKADALIVNTRRSR